MTPDLIRAAEIIDSYAEFLKDCHCEAGVWHPDPYARQAQRDYEEYRALASRLRNLVS